jgi:hypothetical protein
MIHNLSPSNSARNIDSTKQCYGNFWDGEYKDLQKEQNKATYALSTHRELDNCTGIKKSEK